MKASDFAPPPRRPFPAWVRVASLIPLYGVAWPIVKMLELFGVWPKLMSRRPLAPAAAFGDYRASAHDVIVSSYFKAGTTWTLQIATQIAFRGQAEFDNLHYAVPWPDVPAPPLARFMIPLADPSPAKLSPTGLRVIKTHLTREHVPFAPEARYIAVTRDPKDCTVSGYHFLRSLALGPLMPTVDHWMALSVSRPTSPIRGPSISPAGGPFDTNRTCCSLLAKSSSATTLVWCARSRRSWASS